MFSINCNVTLASKNIIKEPVLQGTVVKNHNNKSVDVFMQHGTNKKRNDSVHNNTVGADSVIT